MTQMTQIEHVKIEKTPEMGPFLYLLIVSDRDSRFKVFWDTPLVITQVLTSLHVS